MARSEADLLPLDETVFGGSFDPVHRGHLFTARFLIENGYTSRIRFVPAWISPFKRDSVPADADLRMEMLSRGIREAFSGSLQKNISIDDREIRRQDVSFTHETLHSLRSEFPERVFGFLLGEDAFLSFRDWKKPGEILKNHALLVLRRDSADDAAFEHMRCRLLSEVPEARIIRIENPQIQCSSTEIRNHLSRSVPEDHKSKKYLEECLQGDVLGFIREKGLYRKNP